MKIKHNKNSYIITIDFGTQDNIEIETNPISLHKLTKMLGLYLKCALNEIDYTNIQIEVIDDHSM